MTCNGPGTIGENRSCATATGSWVHRNQLKTGMVVRVLDRPWAGSGLPFNSTFRIDSMQLLRDVQDACEYACVEQA